MNMMDLYEAVLQNIGLLKRGTTPPQIKTFQTGIYNSLKNNSAVNGYTWSMNYLPPNSNVTNSIDIFGQKAGAKDWIIEIDAWMAGQVAKKMLSRFALYGLKNPIQYVAVLYPGTKSMNKGKCYKYLKDGNEILKKLYKNSSVIGIIVDIPDNSITIYIPQ